MDYKLILSLLTIPLTVFLFIPYIRDVLNKSTQPHIYTWLIWSITMSIALIGGYEGGSGNLIFITLGIPTLFVMVVFLLSCKYGTKNITLFDTIILLLAISSIGTLVFIKNPLFAVILASLADALGYAPTYRKSFIFPYSETLIFWIGSVLVGVLQIYSLQEYSITTLLYIMTITLSNIVLIFILIGRRKYLK